MVLAAVREVTIVGYFDDDLAAGSTCVLQRRFELA